MWPWKRVKSTVPGAASQHQRVLQALCAQRKHRVISDDALLVHIKAIYADTRGSNGWPRIWRALFGRGILVGRERVQKLMKLHGIRAKGKSFPSENPDENRL